METRSAIRRAALDLALEYGVENLTVEAISEAADVSRRTFFNYFAYKEDALITDSAKAAARLRELIAERPLAEHPLHSLRVMLTDNDPFSLSGANRERTLARQKLVQDNPALMSRQLAQHAVLERELTDMLAARYGLNPAQDLRPALVAGVAGKAFQVAVRHWAIGGSTPLVELLGQAFDQLTELDLNEPPPGE